MGLGCHQDVMSVLAPSADPGRHVFAGGTFGDPGPHRLSRLDREETHRGCRGWNRPLPLRVLVRYGRYFYAVRASTCSTVPGTDPERSVSATPPSIACM